MASRATAVRAKNDAEKQVPWTPEFQRHLSTIADCIGGPKKAQRFGGLPARSSEVPGVAAFPWLRCVQFAID